nr:peptidylprolyl isomerase [Candidatus Reidiella endopervernicosa]
MPPTPHVLLETNVGNITIQLHRDKAPVTVENFLTYVNSGFYNGTVFHRVISDFMIQGGGFTKTYTKKATRDEIKNEADNGLKNRRGSVAMARTSIPHSATAQFFINTVNNSFLNHSAKTKRGWGYAVFGEVVKGMDVVDKIEQMRTGSGGPFPRDVPQDVVIIERASVVDDKTGTAAQN